MGLVLVTGAAGFLGSAVSAALLDHGWQVRGVDAFTPTYDPLLKRDNVVPLLGRNGFELVEEDLCTADLAPVLAGVDAVVHLAGEPGIPRHWGASLPRYVAHNVTATQRLLAEAASGPVRRLVYASSSSVYGESPVAVDEQAPLRALNPYGATKLAAEQLVSAFGVAHGVATVALRCFSAYGPRQRPDMAVSRMIAALLERRPVTVYGDGRQVRDLVFVADVAHAAVAALTADVTPGTVVNVASGAPVAMDALLEMLGDLVDGRPPVVDQQPARPGERRDALGSVRTAQEILGWTPTTDLPTGLAAQVRWQRERQARPALHVVPPRQPDSPRTGRRRPPPRMLIYSQDGLGLGHLRRTSALATQFLAARPGASVLTVSDSPLGRFFPMAEDHDYVKLPSIRKAGPGDWRPLSLSMPFPEVLDLRKQLIRGAVASFRPDVVLVDHMPHGAMGELVPALEDLSGGASRVVLGLRDIVDAPDVVRARWAVEGAYEAVEQYYDEVLVYGSQDVFDVTQEYDWPVAAARRATYCGYVCAPAQLRGVERLRRRTLAGRPDAQHVVAMAGGGADAHPLFRALLEALPAVDAESPVVLTMVTGPFMPQPLRRDLFSRARGLPVRLLDTVSDAQNHLAAADLVVAMAGYNTTTEILQLARPALLVPRAGPSAEQRMRARLFAERGWVRWLEPDGLHAGALAGAVLRALEDAAARREQALPRAQRPDLEGRSAAVARLLALLEGNDQAAPSLSASRSGGR